MEGNVESVNLKSSPQIERSLHCKIIISLVFNFHLSLQGHYQTKTFQLKHNNQ